MNKTFIITALLALSSLALTGCTLSKLTNPSPITTLSVATTASDTTETLLTPFTSIDIDALSPNVKIITGEDYAIEYKLHNREHIDILQVEDGVLVFDTGYDFEFDVDYGNFFIEITVPEDITFDNIDVKTIAGNIYTDVEHIENTSLVATSGKITVENSHITNIYAKSTSEDINISGVLQNVDISSVAGDCQVTSDKLSGDVQTVSGDISVNTTETLISASSFGEIKYFGENKGYRYESSNPNLNLVSVSGKIIVK